jgi:hypothetical protein
MPGTRGKVAGVQWSACSPCPPDTPPRPRPISLQWLALTLLALASLELSAANRLSRDETILIFPTYAARTNTPPAAWQANLHVWIGEREPRNLALGTLRRALGLATDLTPDETTVFHERARWFLADNERGKRVGLRVGDRRFTLGPTAANGHAFATLQIAPSPQPSPTTLPTHPHVLQVALDPSPADPQPQGRLFLIPEHGLSVISDIDDTLKLTEVRDRAAMLRNTFLLPFQPAPGMATLLEHWHTNDHAQFHYVSASPWQLYPALAGFFETHRFPMGTFHLKTFRWKDQSFFDLFRSPIEFKLGVIEPILAAFPHRRFRLVGDSGEADPEVYGELARRYPRQIERIYIRDVTGAPADDERYRAAFRELPPQRWILFQHPSAERFAE